MGVDDLSESDFEKLAEAARAHLAELSRIRFDLHRFNAGSLVELRDLLAKQLEMVERHQQLNRRLDEPSESVDRAHDLLVHARDFTAEALDCMSGRSYKI